MKKIDLYMLKRFFTLFVIMTVCFVLVKLLEPNEILDVTQAEREEAIREALGYNKPILVQYLIYWKNILTAFDFASTNFASEHNSPRNERLYVCATP